MRDDIARYNKERWEELARANVAFSRPVLDLDETSARKMVDPEGKMGEVAGKDVLCLAGGGGQQSAAFALLGAHVTVLDLSETQLARDREAARHYGTKVRAIQGDMRDLSCFDDDSFDLVWHAHSLSFAPDARRVFDEVARVIRPAGRYRLDWTNPFIHGVWENWDGKGYALCRPYLDESEVTYKDTQWDFDDGAGERRRVEGPREFRHALGAIVNGLIARGFVVLGLWEGSDCADINAEPGSWQHFQATVPPWLILWAEYQPPGADASRRR